MTAMPIPTPQPDAVPPDAPVIEQIALARIVEHSNTRKTFDAAKLEELAHDIVKRGVLQPVLVRPLGDDYELVFGARRVRASKLAQREYVPAIVREMSDADVLETQIIENAKREDITVLEEAEAFERLQTEHGYSVEDINAKIGKSVAYVYARLKLCALVPAARKALADGVLTASTALLVARVPPALQPEAVNALKPANNWRVADDVADEGAPDPLGAREAFTIIRERFMLRLDEAPFDRADAELVPKAGACTTCVKRTGNQPELFSDVKSADTCTDVTCFNQKKDGHWVQLKKKAEANGQRVLSEKETKKAIPFGHVAYDSGFVDLAEKHYDASGKGKSYRAILGKDVKPVLARDERGNIHELVPKAALASVLKEQGKELPRSRAELSSGDRKRREESAVRREVVKRGVAQIAAGAEKASESKALWLVLAHSMIRGSWHDTITDVAARRGVEIPKGKRAEDIFREQLGTMTEGQARALVIEFAVTRGVHFEVDEKRAAKDPHPFNRACDLFKVDAKKLEADVRKERAAAPTSKKAPPAVTQPPAAAPKAKKKAASAKQASAPKKAAKAKGKKGPRKS